MNVYSYASDLTALIERGYESIDVDYKGPGSWLAWSDEQKAELVRDMMGMANSDRPGWIIIGVTEDGAGGWTHDGLSDADAASFDHTNIGIKAKRHADPEVSFTVQVAEINGKKFVAVRVEPFATLPHVCRTSSGRRLEEGGFYIRTQAAQTSKVTTADQMRTIIDRATQIHADSIVGQIRHYIEIAQLRSQSTPASDRFESEAEDARKRSGEHP